MRIVFSGSGRNPFGSRSRKAGFLSGLFHAIGKIFGFNSSPINPPPVAPPVSVPAAPTPIAQPTSATTTESSVSTDNLPFINRKKTTLASGSNFGLGVNSNLGG